MFAPATLPVRWSSAFRLPGAPNRLRRVAGVAAKRSPQRDAAKHYCILSYATHNIGNDVVMQFVQAFRVLFQYSDDWLVNFSGIVNLNSLFDRKVCDSCSFSLNTCEDIWMNIVVEVLAINTVFGLPIESYCWEK